MNMPVSPYNKFGNYLKKYFGCRVHKVTLDAGFTCPNRDGYLSYDGCTYCNNQGFSSNTRIPSRSLEEQLAEGISYFKSRFNAEKFIAYFQAYTNTYAALPELKKRYDVVRSFEDIVGISIGTRPDCVTPEILDLIESYSDKYTVWVEYGLQTIHEKTLKRINRGHTYESFLKAIAMTANRKINMCAHVILGLPGETSRDMMDTAGTLAQLPIHGLKLHILHVMKDTPLEGLYNKGEIKLLSFEEYVGLVCDFLERIPYEFTIQRLTADAPASVLVAPLWVTRKMEILSAIEKEFARRGSFQGRFFAQATV